MRKDKNSGYFDGQLLLAMPGMPDDRFARCVIYLCAHSDEGAMGIIINRRAPSLNFSELLVQLEVIAPDEAIRLPAQAGAVPVLNGGPVETGPRLRAAFERFLHRQFDLAYRRRRVAHRDHRHSARHRPWRRPRSGRSGARLRRLVARPTGRRDAAQRLAHLPCR